MIFSARHAIWMGGPLTLAAAAVCPAATTYMTEAQALEALFGRDVTVRREGKELSQEDRRRLEASTGLHFPESSYTFLVAQRQDRLAGYALVLDEIGKSEPITFMVGISPEAKISDVVLMVFRESRGDEVKDRRFLRQFRGKSVGDPIRVNQDILNYSGATLSSKAIARGTKRALLLLDLFYPPATRRVPAHSLAAGRNGSRFVLPAPQAAIAQDDDLALYRQTRYRMGTLCEIRVWTRSPREAGGCFAGGFAELDRIDGVFSNYRDDSELARVNSEAADTPVEASREFWDLTRYAVRQWRQSRGRFDITVGPLVRAWGFWDGRPHVPREEQLEEARARVGSGELELNPRRRTIRFERPGMELDFGGLAKGYAAMRAARLAKACGAVAALVNLGGSSLYAAGPERAREFPSRWTQQRCGVGEWPVAVANPVEPHRCALYIVLQPGLALSTSGTYEQRFQEGNRSFSHLIDPRTGRPVEGLRAATVLARSGRRAEAMTKQLLLEGAERKGLLRHEDCILLAAGPGNELVIRQRLPHTLLLRPIE